MKRYKCNDCGCFISVLPGDTATACPACDGILTPVPDGLVSSSVKVQRLTFQDGLLVALVSGQQTRAFRWANWLSVPDWEPMDLRDVFRPYSKTVSATGRIF